MMGSALVVIRKPIDLHCPVKTTCPHCRVNIEIDQETHALLQLHANFDCPSCNGIVRVPELTASRESAHYRHHAVRNRPRIPKGKRIMLALGIAVSALMAFLLTLFAYIGLDMWLRDKSFPLLVIIIVSLASAVVMARLSWKMSSFVRRFPNQPQSGSKLGPFSTAGACPLCSNDKHMKNASVLYEYLVCGRCISSFANRRQLAYILDIFITNVTSFVSLVLISLIVAKLFRNEMLQSAIGFGFFLLPALLFVIKDGFSGQSIGKSMCGVMVLDETTGKPSGLMASFKRNLPLLIPIMPVVGAIQMNNGHRIGDRWAKTKVVWKKYENHFVFKATGGLSYSVKS